jgi:hypothetical protein
MRKGGVVEDLPSAPILGRNPGLTVAVLCPIAGGPLSGLGE